MNLNPVMPFNLFPKTVRQYYISIVFVCFICRCSELYQNVFAIERRSNVSLFAVSRQRLISLFVRQLHKIMAVVNGAL